MKNRERPRETVATKMDFQFLWEIIQTDHRQVREAQISFIHWV